MRHLRDPNAPKRPTGAFFAFSNDIREEVATDTGLSGVKLTPIIGERWKSLIETEKEKYKEEASKAHDKWKTAYDRYKKTSDFTKHVVLKKEHKVKQLKKQTKDPNRPKRCVNSYCIFMAERMRNSANVKQDMTKFVSQWKALNDSRKAAYQSKANEDKIRWLREITKYQKTLAYKKWTEQEDVRKKALDTVTGKSKSQKEADKIKEKKTKDIARKKLQNIKKKAVAAKKKAIKAAQKTKRDAKKKAIVEKKKIAAKKKAANKKKSNRIKLSKKKKLKQKSKTKKMMKKKQSKRMGRK